MISRLLSASLCFACHALAGQVILCAALIVRGRKLVQEVHDRTLAKLAMVAHAVETYTGLPVVRAFGRPVSFVDGFFLKYDGFLKVRVFPSAPCMRWRISPPVVPQWCLKQHSCALLSWSGSDLECDLISLCLRVGVHT